MEEETIEAKISQLPYDIIGRILNRKLSSIPIEKAFQTCLFSKRWNTNLSMLPSVNLNKIFIKNYNCDPPKYELLLNTFDKYLRMREKMNKQVDIERFKLKVFITDSQFDVYMNAWVNILIRCNIKEIVFYTSRILAKDYAFPRAIFFAKSLTSLHLRKCKLECKGFSDIKLVSLKRLVLEYVDISNELIQQLIESCGVMEELSLSFCDSLTALKVAGLLGLNKLTLVRNYNLETLEIDEPSLLSFTYWGPYGVGVNFTNCRGLKELHMAVSDITGEWLGEQLLLLEHLEELKIELCREIRFLSIHNRHLKRFYLMHCRGRLEVNIDAPNLQSFCLDCAYCKFISLSLSAPPTLEVNLDIHSKVFGPGLYIDLLNILGFFDHSRLNLKTNLPNSIIPQEWMKCFFGTKSAARFRKSWVDPEARLVDVLRSIFPAVKSHEDQKCHPKILTEDGIEVTPTTEGEEQKGKNTLGSSPVSPSPSVFNSAELTNELALSSNALSTEQHLRRDMDAIMEKLSQMENSRREDQQRLLIARTKEESSLEAAVCRIVEEGAKAKFDALFACFQEGIAKQETVALECQQQTISLIANSLTKELPGILEKILERESGAVGPAVACAVNPVIEETVSVAIADLFQETLKTTVEAIVVPAFDRACQAMFEQVDDTFEKGTIEYSTATLQQLESKHSSLEVALREDLDSTSSLKQSLNSELAHGMRKVIALGIAGANSEPSPLITPLSNVPLGSLHDKEDINSASSLKQPLNAVLADDLRKLIAQLSALADKIEVPLNPITELSGLISEHKYEEAFSVALRRCDVSLVSWLCFQVDVPRVLSAGALSQGVLLSLFQQLACDITTDTLIKLWWMTHVAMVIKPSDPYIVKHLNPIFVQVYQVLYHHHCATLDSVTETHFRLLMYVIRSMLMGW